MFGVYPKTVRENLRFRATVVEECDRDMRTAQVVKAVCERDPLFFFNTFLWAEDPFAEKGLRSGIPRDRFRPIVTYPFQDETILDIVKCIEVGESGVGDKSRDMLATYMVMGVYLWGWLFKGHKYMISSWKEDEIDGKADTSTHFGKLRFMLERLPWFLVPQGWDWKKHSTYMKLQNPENKGTITGSAASRALASGRREDSIFLDELSKWESNQREAWVSASDATRCKIGFWTPRGSGNFAAELMRGDEVKHKWHLMWYRHPEKCYTSEDHLARVKAGGIRDKVRGYTVTVHPDQSKSPSGCYVDHNGKIRSEWYDRECEERGPDDIAENLDCDYLTTGRPVFDTVECQKKLYECRPPKMKGDLRWVVPPIFDPSTGNVINQSDLKVELIPNPNGVVSIWDEPFGGYEYGFLIGADTAEGLEQHDYDSAFVLDRVHTKVVASLHGHLRIHEYAEELAKLGVYYHQAIINVERNQHGHGVLAHLVKMYGRIFGKAVFSRGYAEITDKLGHDTTKQSKGVIIGTLGKAIAEETFDCPDEGFWKETLTFVNDDGRMEAQGKTRGERCFDDRVMAAAIMWWSSSEMPLPSKKREKPSYEGWRLSRQKKAQNRRLVGWIV